MKEYIKNRGGKKFKYLVNIIGEEKKRKRKRKQGQRKEKGWAQGLAVKK